MSTRKGGSLGEFFKKPVFFVILVVAIIVASIWAWYSNYTTEKQTKQQVEQQTQQQTAQNAAVEVASNLTNVDAESVQSDFNQNLQTADAKAAEVDKKLQLVAVDVVLPGELYINSGTIFFVYSSSSDKINNWVIGISNSGGNFVRSRTPKVDYMGELTPINRSYIKNNYLAALLTAEKNGGKNFREAYPPSEVKITLKNADPKGWLYWFVEYAGQKESKSIQIDAGAGTVVEKTSTGNSSTTTTSTSNSINSDIDSEEQ